MKFVYEFFFVKKVFNQLVIFEKENFFINIILVAFCTYLQVIKL